jgi:hypothetical protein
LIGIGLAQQLLGRLAKAQALVPAGAQGGQREVQVEDGVAGSKVGREQRVSDTRPPSSSSAFGS